MARGRCARAAFALVVLAALVAVPAGAGVSVIGGDAARGADGLWKVPLDDGTVLFTHGADPVPNHGGSMGAGDPERAPVCATDYYQHVLYGYLNGAPNRVATVRATVQASIRRMNYVLNEEAIASGNRTADYKVRCDASGSIQVDAFAANAMDFDSVSNSARLAGYALPNVDYTIFFDAQPNGVCGVGSFVGDERLTANNGNNGGGGYAVVYNQCWTNETAMHENGHNQGAVQYSAPYSTGSGAHCVDENDVMCYSPDGGNLNQGGTINRCSGTIRFDCEFDAYFDTAVEPGEYLETHWNLGSTLNRFIAFGPPGNLPPVPSFTFACDELTCTFDDTSTDDGAIADRTWDFGDGTTSAVADPVHTYAAQGSYYVTLTVRDDDAATASTSATVHVPQYVDPDPATDTLQNNEPTRGRSSRQGTWRYYKVILPQGRASLSVSVDGPDCILLLCNPDLDLYLRPAQKPTTTEYACRADALSADETCAVTNPSPGLWYIGVYTFFGVIEANFTITARY